MVRLNNVSESVENALCEVAGLELPDTIENCGGADCARWVAEDWRPCFKSKCIAWHAAIQRRTVYCDKDGTRVTDQECPRKSKPAMKRECYSEKCRGVWRADEWSEVGVCLCGSGHDGRRDLIVMIVSTYTCSVKDCARATGLDGGRSSASGMERRRQRERCARTCPHPSS